MRNEPALPDEAFLITFGGALISILVLLVILKIMQIREQRKNPDLYRAKHKVERRPAAPKKKRRRNRP